MIKRKSEGGKKASHTLKRNITGSLIRKAKCQQRTEAGGGRERLRKIHVNRKLKMERWVTGISKASAG